MQGADCCSRPKFPQELDTSPGTKEISPFLTHPVTERSTGSCPDVPMTNTAKLQVKFEKIRRSDVDYARAWTISRPSTKSACIS